MRAWLSELGQQGEGQAQGPEWGPAEGRAGGQQEGGKGQGKGKGKGREWARPSEIIITLFFFLAAREQERV